MFIVSQPVPFVFSTLFCKKMTLILRGNQFCKSIALKRSFTKQHIYDTFIALGWSTVSEIIMKTNVKQKEKTILKLKEFSLLTTK